MARTSNLSDFLTDVSQAIKDKKGDQTPILASNFDTEITNLPSGGGQTEAPFKDVNFYDYDGFRCYSYTVQEFLQLTKMPENPTHNGLISQGWNWSLAGAKTFVETYKILEIGQLYKTDDNSVRLYIKTTRPEDIELLIKSTGDSTVDWGDGTTSDMPKNTSVSHSYISNGNYCIRIIPNEGVLYEIPSGGTQWAYATVSNILKYPNETVSMCKNTAGNLIYKVELPDDVLIRTDAFSGLKNLETITIPKLAWFNYQRNLNMSEDGAFKFCNSLKHLNLPRIREANLCSGCSSLKRICIGEGLEVGSGNIYGLVPENDWMSESNYEIMIYPTTSTAGPVYRAERQKKLKILIYPDTLRAMPSFQMCTKLEYIRAPKSTTRISDYAFRYCTNLKVCDFSNVLQVPTINSASTLDYIPSQCKFIVPDALYDDWIVADFWSRVASQIVKASEYYGN